MGGSEGISVTIGRFRVGVDDRGSLTRGPRAGAVPEDARLQAPAGTHGWEVPGLGILGNTVEVVGGVVDDPRGGATEGH